MAAARIAVAPLRRRDRGGRPGEVVRSCYLGPLGEEGALLAMLCVAAPRQAAEHLCGYDGLLLPGGGDIHPRTYGAQVAADLDLEEDDVGDYQLALARAALQASLPTLGICLGCQVMAVAAGGSLLQALDPARPAAVSHGGSGLQRHGVRVTPGSRLAAALGSEQLTVPSQHRQAIDRPGEGVAISAVAPDEVIEGIERPQLPWWIGVQWHPERALDEAANRRLLASFTAACRERRAGRG